MTARSSRDTTKIHIHVFTDDLDLIDSRCCRQGERTVGRSRVLRTIIHAFANKLRETENDRVDARITESLGRSLADDLGRTNEPIA